jgi:hypothetical protein
MSGIVDKFDVVMSNYFISEGCEKGDSVDDLKSK